MIKSGTPWIPKLWNPLSVAASSRNATVATVGESPRLTILAIGRITYRALEPLAKD